MSEQNLKVSIKHPVGADEVDVSEDPFYKGAYVISIPLDSEPSYAWQTLFQHELQTSLDIWDRNVAIVGKHVKLVTSPDHVTEKLDWLEHVFAATNRRVEEQVKNARAQSSEVQIRIKQEQEIKTELSKWMLKRVGTRE